MQTTRWFYETGFRRYVRALEGVRTSKAAIAAAASEAIGSVSSGADALGEWRILNAWAAFGLNLPVCVAALLNQRRTTPSASSNSPVQRTQTSVALENAQIEGPPIIAAHIANDRSLVRLATAIRRDGSVVSIADDCILW